MRKFLAFDIGGTSIKYGVLTEDGTILENDECATNAHLGGLSIIEKIKEIGQPYIRKYTLSGVCVSTAGQVNSEQGTIIFASELIPQYTGVNVKGILEDYFQLPVEVENDVNCAGLAESWIGTGRDAKSIFCLTIGTGIGGSFIFDKKVYTGHCFSAGEIGYIPIEGSQFQELASTRILVQNVAHAKGIDVSEINGKQIFELAKAGDEICIKEIEKVASYLSKGIATIAYMMNPEMIIIGGGITAQKDYLYPMIMKALEKDIMPAILNKTKIEIARSLNNAGIIGALRHWLVRESLKPIQSIKAIIESNKHRLTGREQMLATYIDDHLEEISNKTISELSSQTKVSEATITRFCQKLEFGTYNKFRLLAKEATVSSRIYESGDATLLGTVKNEYLDMLKKFETLFKQEEITDCIDKLLRAKQIHIYSVSDTGFIGTKVKFKLMELGLHVDAFTDPYQLKRCTQLVNTETLVIGISVSGYTSDIVDAMESAKQKGAMTIGVTSQQDSPLSTVVDNLLLVPSSVSTRTKGYVSKEVPILYLFDILLKELEQARKCM